MTRLTPAARFWLIIGAVALGMVAAQVLFLNRPGLQEDETAFVTPILRGYTPLYAWNIGSLQIPVMQADYAGSLKSWLYWPVFKLWPPGVWSIRLPMCIVSVMIILVFSDLVRRVANARVAIYATLLLASDAIFVFVNVFDWGPVSLLLLGTVSFLNLLHRFASSNRHRFLVMAFFLAGLMVWYKTLFVAILAGAVAAFAVVYFDPFRRRISARMLLACLCPFILGAAPLIAFNLQHRGATLTASSYLTNPPLAEKLVILQHTLDGRALEHYMFRSFSGEAIALRGAPIGDLVISWYRTSHLFPGSMLLVSLGAALIALPFLHAATFFRPILFAWVATAAIAAMMLAFPPAGGGPHHTVLIYPGPQFIVAATAISLFDRWKARRMWLFAMVAITIGSNALLLGEYFHAAARYGFSAYWTDGIKSLADVAKSEQLPVAALDWGIRNGIRIESGDTIPITGDTTPRKGVLYAGHLPKYTINEAREKFFQAQLAATGLEVTGLQTISDKQGNPMFHIFRLRDGPR